MGCSASDSTRPMPALALCGPACLGFAGKQGFGVRAAHSLQSLVNQQLAHNQLPIQLSQSLFPFPFFKKGSLLNTLIGPAPLLSGLPVPLRKFPEAAFFYSTSSEADDGHKDEISIHESQHCSATRS